ncbi:T9SS type A sorting domain-containing protein [Mucilaginibacter ginsenosidivorans]|uniref:T9SS type A sorting domain-containing protein n=1 Tax=Mucilaginibacter ginsenosidivorans TaxID=398053 RepID=A0A5B8V2U6_9SPHI|nr:T9SS type A sorting domain-containing protein [Mucilaginibacter ginsenosidivorans]QEC65479.1 T9SS type A sorting domain-containing protein [Mucilaginibacter ginsenosidivorans]
MRPYWKALLLCCIVQFAINTKSNATCASEKIISAKSRSSSKYIEAQASKNAQFLRLKLVKDAASSEDIIIQFKPTASEKYVFDEDAPYLQGFGNVNLCSLSSDNIGLAINVLPLPGKEPDAIKLNIQATGSGILQLNLAEINAIPMLYDVWLMDKFAHDSLDMRQNKSYTFKLDKADTTSFGPNRFTLTIRQNPAYAYRLINFDAVRIRGGHSFVQWATNYEGDYTHFAVERSNDDGLTFNVIGNVPATGTGTYSFTDSKPLKGLNIYRLQQEDVNKTITYSNNANVLFDDRSNIAADNSLSIYPNPAISMINVVINPDVNDETSFVINVMDGSGKVVQNGSTGQTSWQGSIANLQPGTYFVRVISIKSQSLVGKTRFVKL